MFFFQIANPKIINLYTPKVFHKLPGPKKNVVFQPSNFQSSGVYLTIHFLGTLKQNKYYDTVNIC